MSWSNEWAKTEAVQPTAPSNPYDAMNEDQLLMEHKKLQDDLSALKEREMELRKYIVNRAFPKKEEGVNKRELGAGYTLKATIKYNYVLDSDNDKIDAALEKLAKVDNEGSFIADRLVNWKATLSVSEYRQLDPKYKKIIDEVVTVNDAAPTLEIVEPKKK